MDQFLDYWLSVLSTARPLPQSLIVFFYGILFQLKIPVKILTYRFMWQIKPSSYYKWDYIQSCVCVCVCVDAPYVLHLHYMILHFLYISIIKQQQGLYTWTILIFLIKKKWKSRHFLWLCNRKPCYEKSRMKAFVSTQSPSLRLWLTHRWRFLQQWLI